MKKEKEKNNYCIYKHTNKQNNKVYIGQTCQKPEYRWNHGEGYKQCPAFYSAIQKYGWNNFKHEILLENLTQEEANQKEQEYIQLYKSTQKEFGYNIFLGGNNKEFSEETKQKLSQYAQQLWQNPEHKQHISEIMKEKWQDPEYRKKQEKYKKEHIHIISEEGKKRISEARKLYIKEHGTPTQGKEHTEEVKEKIRQSKLGEKNPMYGKHHTEEFKQKMKEKFGKKVQCLETGEIFISISEACKWCGLKSKNGIIKCLAGERKTSGKHPETGESLHWQAI